MEWAYKAKAMAPDSKKMAFLSVLGMEEEEEEVTTPVATLAVGVRTAFFRRSRCSLHSRLRPLATLGKEKSEVPQAKPALEIIASASFRTLSPGNSILISSIFERTSLPSRSVRGERRQTL